MRSIAPFISAFCIAAAAVAQLPPREAQQVRAAQLGVLGQFAAAEKRLDLPGQAGSVEKLKAQRLLFLLSTAADYPAIKQVALSRTDPSPYAGRYGLGDGRLVRLVVREGALGVGHGADSPITWLTEAAPGNYKRSAGGLWYIFYPDTDGKAADILVSEAPRYARRVDPTGFTTIRIETSIAGDSRLVLRGTTAQWFNSRGVPPGRDPEHQFPTTINGAEWTPKWFNFAGRADDYGVRSDVFNGVAPGVPASPADVHCTVIRARDRVHVVRQPATLVDDAIVIDFVDNAWHLDKYVVHIHYRARPQPPPAKAPTMISKNGLVGEYRFAGDASDSSGNANHGIAERITAAADRFGAPAKAIRFESYGSVKIPAPDPLTNGNLAISIWVNCRAFPELTEWYPWSSCILSQHDGARARHFQLAGHRRFFSWNRFQRSERRLSATEPAEVNRWYHLVAQTDGVVHELYVDGVLQDSTRGDYTFNPDMPLYVGRNGDQERSLYFNGAVDDLRLYNRLLTPAGIQALYHEDGYGKPPGLVNEPPPAVPRPDHPARLEAIARWGKRLAAATATTAPVIKHATGPAQRYTGRYLLDDGAVFEVVAHNNKLLLHRAAAATTHQLTAVGADRFVAAQAQFVCQFTIGRGDQADGLLVTRVRGIGSVLPEQPHYRIEARIDERSALHLGGKSMHWVNHCNSRAPGRDPRDTRPTMINETAWLPVFADATGPQNIGSAVSFPFNGLAEAIPLSSSRLRVVFPRNPGISRVAQWPGPVNGHTLILDFHDDALYSTRDYTAEIYIAPPRPGQLEQRHPIDPTRLAVPESGLVAWYPLDGNVVDQHRGTAAADAQQVEYAINRFGRRMRALRLLKNSRVMILAPPDLGGDAMSFSIWVNLDGQQTDTYSNYILAQHLPRRNFALALYRDRITWRAHPPHLDQTAALPVVEQEWHHVAITYNGAIQALYVDGALQSSSRLPLQFNPEAPLQLGFDPDNPKHGFDGTLDDFRVYDRALQPREVLALYHENNFDLDPPLTAAVKADRPTAVINKLVAEYREIDVADRRGNTPLHWAARAGNTRLVQALLRHKARHTGNAAGATPLLLAIQNGHDHATALLLKNGADVNATNHYGRTPLHAAAATGNVPVAKQLLDGGAGINALDWNGDTPFHRAAVYGRIEMGHLLIAGGVDTEVHNLDERHAFDLALQMNQIAFAREMAAAGVWKTTAHEIQIAAQPGPVKILVARRVEKPVGVDGNISGAEYGHAVPGHGMVYCYTDRVAIDDTYFVAAWDDANLYFGTVALQSGADELPLSRLAQDSMEIFKDHDHLELMLDTNHDRNSFFQCCWNFKGSKWDFAYSAPRVAVDWSPAWEVTTEVQHNAFISELAIPLSALGGAKPKPGDTWGFTLARQQSAASGAVRYTIWSEYFRGDFLKPGLWSILKFE